MANIFEFLSKDGNIPPEKVRKSRQMQFHDKTAYVWGLRYRWNPSLSMKSFAIEEPGSPVPALYATLVCTVLFLWSASQCTIYNAPYFAREITIAAIINGTIKYNHTGTVYFCIHCVQNKAFFRERWRWSAALYHPGAVIAAFWPEILESDRRASYFVFVS